MSIRNTRGRAWIARVLLCAQAFSNMCRVRVFLMARPVESETVADPVVVAVESVVLVITVRAVCDLESHVVVRIQHRRMRITRSACLTFKSLEGPTRPIRFRRAGDMICTWVLLLAQEATLECVESPWRTAFPANRAP